MSKKKEDSMNTIVKQENESNGIDDEINGHVESTINFDEDLLERARTQWQFGDWESLVAIDNEELKTHQDRAKLALLSAAGYQQLGAIQDTRRLVRNALSWGVNRRVVAEILTAGVHNTLGRAFALGEEHQSSLDQFFKSINTGTPGAEVRLLTAARVGTQFHQLGLSGEKSFLQIADSDRGSNGYANQIETKKENEEDNENNTKAIDQDQTTGTKSPRYFLDSGKDLSTSIRLADMSMMRGDWNEAIQRWQDIISLIGESSPDYVYTRLDQAYLKKRGQHKGSEEEENMFRDVYKHEVLHKIHDTLQPRLYLVIGVGDGKNIRLASCKAIGVDPVPRDRGLLGDNVEIVDATSDEFFADVADILLATPPDLVLIDNMPLIDYILRDLNNLERYASKNTLIVVTGIFPPSVDKATRRRSGSDWYGDVWKLPEILQRFRPDLRVLQIDASSGGLLMIAGFEKKNGNSLLDVLSKESKYLKDYAPPEEVIHRHGAVSIFDEGIINFIVECKKN
jgi:hypothetical protein